MLRGSKYEMFVNLVANSVGVVLLQQAGDEGEFVGGEDFARGVHRAVQQDRLGPGAKGRGQRVSRGKFQCGGSSRTRRGTAPSRRTIGR